MATFILRKMDDDLWARVKARATQDQLSLRSLMVALLRGYADGRISVQGSDGTAVG